MRQEDLGMRMTAREGGTKEIKSVIIYPAGRPLRKIKLEKRKERDEEKGKKMQNIR